MESNDVDKKVQRQLRRIAAAFNIRCDPSHPLEHGPQFAHFQWRFDSPKMGADSQLVLDAQFRRRDGQLWRLELWSGHNAQTIKIIRPFPDEKWDLRADPDSEKEMMARALYCLGFEDKSILAQLPPLSAHEKMELRLSMPRDFWPQSWLDEEATASEIHEKTGRATAN